MGHHHSKVGSFFTKVGGDIVHTAKKASGDIEKAGEDVAHTTTKVFGRATKTVAGTTAHCAESAVDTTKSKGVDIAGSALNTAAHCL